MSYDISEFINGPDGKGRKTLLISDFEGTTPIAHFEKFKEYCDGTGEDGSKTQVIFLGDIFDNTAQFGPNCKGDVCDDPDDMVQPCPTDENYCVLKTIKLLVDNEDRCKYVFGNRDINKIKLVPFFSIESNTGDEIKWWTIGNTYVDIVKNLFSILKKPQENNWMINGENVKYFRPFWKTTTDKKTNKTYNSEDYIKNTTWMNDEPQNIHDIYHRFELMFGKDADKGTMSALVSLKCIPNEVIGGDNMLQFYKDVYGESFEILPIPSKEERDKKGSDYNKDKVEAWEHNSKERKKVRAALTITILMRMLTMVLSRNTDEITVFGSLDGYLKHYLTNAPAAYYAETTDRKNILLFAHGGISEQFVSNVGKNQVREKDIDNWNTIVENKNGSTDYWEEKKKEKSGGNKNKIFESIEFYNEKCKKLILDFFDKTESNKMWWVAPMLSLLDLSAGPDHKNPNQVKEPSDAVLDTFAADKKIFNIFGHASVSSGYTIGKPREKGSLRTRDGPWLTENTLINENSHTYFINTDFSTTLFKEGIACDNKYNLNYLLLILDTTDNQLGLYCDGHIELNSKYVVDKESIKTIETLAKLVIKNEYKILPGPSNVIEFDKTQNLIDIIDDIDSKNTTTKFGFNGMALGNRAVFSTKWSKSYSYIVLIPYEIKYEDLDMDNPDPDDLSRYANFGEIDVDTMYQTEYTPPEYIPTLEEGDLLGGRKRRTRKHRITKRRPKQMKKKKGGRKTKKRARKTRRKAHKRN